MNYDDLQQNIVKVLQENQAWSRAISLDIEADLNTLGDSSKNILSISTARRDGERIDIRKFILNEETVMDEVRLFNEFGDFCQKFRPLVLLGYGISGFDLPVLLVKMRKLDETFKKDGRYHPGYWAFRDAITRSYVLDMINPVRFEVARFDNSKASFLSLEKAISHKRFEKLPFMKTKNIVSDLTSTGMNKWDVIHNLWKNNKVDFNQYIEGDVHDTLLLAEELFNVKQ